MILATLSALAAPLLAGPAAPAPQELVALKARRVIVGDGTVVEHAVILVDGGRIVTFGQDLPIERGIPVVELDPDQVVMPGLVNAYSRLGLTGQGYNDSRPHVKASAELSGPGMLGAALEAGVTTVALYPAGTGIPGQAVAVRTKGTSAEDVILADGAYLKVVMRNSASNKRNLRKGFEDVEKYREKVEKEREKWEKKNKSSSKKKDDEEGDEEEKDDEKKTSSRRSKKPEPFEPPAPDEDVKPFIDLLEGDLQALVSVSDAADYVHFLDALGDHEIEWHLRLPLSRESNLYEVKERIGERGCFVVTDPAITLHPGTMRQRNLPAELDRAGAKLVLLPRGDNAAGMERWLEDVGVLVGAGLDRDAAVRAITHHPAAFLGLDEELGTIAEGKRANLVVLSGDPFEPGTEVDAVMLDGEFVHGEVNQ